MKHSGIIRNRIKRLLRVNTTHPDPAYRAKALNLAGKLKNFMRQIKAKEAREERIREARIEEEKFYDCDEEMYLEET